MRLALDTNILVYAEGVNGPIMRTRAKALIRSLGRRDVVLPAQSLGELYLVLTRKGGQSAAAAAVIIGRYRSSYEVVYPVETTWTAAFDLAGRHGLQIWDSIILASAADAGCAALLSEDMQNGFVWNGVTIINPFLSPSHPSLIRTP